MSRISWMHPLSLCTFAENVGLLTSNISSGRRLPVFTQQHAQITTEPKPLSHQQGLCFISLFYLSICQECFYKHKLREESHGFPLREHTIKSEKKTQQKYLNVKISKRQFSFSFRTVLFPFALNKNLHPSLWRKKRSQQVWISSTSLPAAHPLLQIGSPCVILQSHLSHHSLPTF